MKIVSGAEYRVFLSSHQTDTWTVQIVLQPKRSILPHHPCTHFVKRPLYAERLRKFFSSYMEYRQIFALWGLGGVGYASQRHYLEKLTLSQQDTNRLGICTVDEKPTFGLLDSSR